MYGQYRKEPQQQQTKPHYKPYCLCCKDKAEKQDKSLPGEYGPRTLMEKGLQTRRMTKDPAQSNASTDPVASGATMFKSGGVWRPKKIRLYEKTKEEKEDK